LPLQTALELAAFQGPLDLLLNLIERRRLAITDVSLAAVADQYLQAVRALPEPDPDLLGEFLVIGARLLLLKSRALLPRADEPDEEAPDDDDLAERLEEYRRFKEAALALAARFEAGAHAFPHAARPDFQDLQPALAPVDAQTLAHLGRSIHSRQPPPPVRDEPVQSRIQVAARLAWLRERFRERATLCWDEVAGGSLDELIATFLAVLELVRRGELRVQQERPFGPIVLRASPNSFAADERPHADPLPKGEGVT
jgi:segregation and condensation protein A